MKRVFWLAFKLAIILPFLSGCSLYKWLNERDFDVAINNRLNIPIAVIVDGDRNRSQTIPAQETHTFTVTKEYSDSWDDGRNGTFYGVYVAITAESRPVSPNTGSASSETRRLWLTTKQATAIEFERNDFYRNGRGPASFELSINNRTTWGLNVYLNGSLFARMAPQSTLGTKAEIDDAEFSNDIANSVLKFSAFNGEKISKEKAINCSSNVSNSLTLETTDW